MSKLVDGGIRIYLRLRPPATAEQSSLMSNSSGVGNQICDYEVEHGVDHSTWKLHVDKANLYGNVNYVDHTKEDYLFSFRRVLEPSVTQEQVFNVVAKDCVQSVVDGYNSTVFAYGQTGSGKTFSITGGTDSYEDRGLIPRSLAMIYDEIGKRKDVNWTVSLSYLQIYNDRGQDLLNHGKDAQRLEDLPNVTVLEGEDEIVLKNLEQHYSPTLSDALSLLFLGDTNRLYCETPMNKTSSRSHCVFMISLEAREVGSSVVRRSKLNLVDLAGSERVSKTGVDGVILNEAKYINLSLHYLEHVIISLSEQAKGRRDHVPYRNSFMTMVLRDSLGANCRTSMLATVHTARSMIPETISTCQFAQRVALIRQNAHVNEETDPVLLLKKLKAEIVQLKDQLAFSEKGGGGSADRVLTSDEHHMCEVMVDNFLRSPEAESRIEGFDGDLAKIYDCFAIMKQIVVKGGGGFSGQGGANKKGGGGGGPLTLLEERTTQLEDYKSQVDALHISLQQKENEMTMLVELLQKTNGPKTNAFTQTSDNGEEEGSESGRGVMFQHKDVHALSFPCTGGGQDNGMLGGHTTGKNHLDYASGARSGEGRPQHYGHAEGVMGRNSFSDTALVKTGTGMTGEATSSSGGFRAPPSHQETSLALAKVQEMGEKGKLSGAEVTAVTSFLQEKEDYLRGVHQQNTVSQSNSSNNNSSGSIGPLVDEELLQNRAAALELFKQSYKGYAKVETMKNQLKTMYEACKSTGLEANAINERIKHLKKDILRHRAERAVEGVEEVSREEEALLDKLREEKQVFTSYIEKVKKQKEEIQGIEAYLGRSKDQLGKHFEEWLQTRQRQVQLALKISSSAEGKGGEGASVIRKETMTRPPGGPLSPTLSPPLPPSPVTLFQSPTGGGARVGGTTGPTSLYGYPAPPPPPPHRSTPLNDSQEKLPMPEKMPSSSLWYPTPPSSAPASYEGGKMLGSSSSRAHGDRQKQGTFLDHPERGVSASASWRALPPPPPPFVFPSKYSEESPGLAPLPGSWVERKAIEESENGTYSIPLSNKKSGGDRQGSPTTNSGCSASVGSTSGRSLPSRLQPISTSIPSPIFPADSGNILSRTAKSGVVASSASPLLHGVHSTSSSPTGNLVSHPNSWMTTKTTGGGMIVEEASRTNNVPNPYAPFYPQLRSTGDAIADQELAALYTAREAMRKKFCE